MFNEALGKYSNRLVLLVLATQWWLVSCEANRHPHDADVYRQLLTDSVAAEPRIDLEGPGPDAHVFAVGVLAGGLDNSTGDTAYAKAENGVVHPMDDHQEGAGGGSKQVPDRNELNDQALEGLYSTPPPESDTDVDGIDDMSEDTFPKYLMPEVLEWDEEISRWSERFEIPKLHIAALMQVESKGNQYAVSFAGAVGLFQVMPEWIDDYCQANNIEMSEETHFDAEINAAVGLAYFKSLLNAAGGNLEAALANYNGGPAAMNWYMGLITKEQYIELIAEWWVRQSKASFKEAREVGEIKAEEVKKHVRRFSSIINNNSY